MAFNTGNPVPSSDARDLSDNAENLDSALNTFVDTWTDRLGSTRSTLSGQLKKLGFESPVVYAGSISFTTDDNTKTIDRNGIVYAPLPSELPFTTSGTWAADDENKFFVVQVSSFGMLLTAETVAEMKTRDLQSGQTIITVRNNLTSEQGGARYLIKTIAEYGATPDGYADHLLDNGNVAVYQYRFEIDAAAFGCVLNGITDDTLAGQAAFSYSAGKAKLTWRGTMLTTTAMLASSNTKVAGIEGVTILKASSTYTGGPSDNRANGALIRNENFYAVGLTDENISVEGVTFDYRDRPSAGAAISGQQVGVFMRYVKGVKVNKCIQYNGGDMTGFLGCLDTFVTNNRCYEVANSPYDHWNSAGRAHVINNIAINETVSFKQGIQFTGDDTNPNTSALLGTGASLDLVCCGNTLQTINDAFNGCIVVNNLDTGASGSRISISNNNTKGGAYSYLLEGNIDGLDIDGGYSDSARDHGVLIIQSTGEINPLKFPRNISISGVNFNNCADSNFVMDVRAGDRVNIDGCEMTGNYTRGVNLRTDVTNSTVRVTARDATEADVIDNGGSNRVVRIAEGRNNVLIYNDVTPNVFTQIDASFTTGAIPALCVLRVTNLTGVNSKYVFRRNGDSVESVLPTIGSGPHICEMQNSESAYVTVMTDSAGILEFLCNQNTGTTQIRIISFIPLANV